MKARTKFLKLFDKFPEGARRELVLMYWNKEPFSLNIVALEVRQNTQRGEKFLEQLGFKDDEEQK